LPTILCAGAHALRCVALVPIRFDDDDDDDATAPHRTALHAVAAWGVGSDDGSRPAAGGRAGGRTSTANARAAFFFLMVDHHATALRRPGPKHASLAAHDACPALPCLLPLEAMQAHQQQAPSRGGCLP
jgi:hypothetical protein